MRTQADIDLPAFWTKGAEGELQWQDNKTNNKDRKSPVKVDKNKLSRHVEWPSQPVGVLHARRNMDVGYICVSGCRKEAVVRHAQHVRSALSSSRSDRGHHWQRKQTTDTPVRFHVVTHQASAMLASWAAQICYRLHRASPSLCTPI